MIDAIGADALASAAHGVDCTRSGVLFIDHVGRVAASVFEHSAGSRYENGSREDRHGD
jgi:hypothetical protein